MRNNVEFHTEAGFSLPETYRIEDRDTTFRVALAVFGFSCAAAAALGLWIAGLV